jgi:hypothetical protein
MLSIKNILISSILFVPLNGYSLEGFDALNLNNLGSFSMDEEEYEDEEESLWSLSGFADVRYGVRTRKAIHQKTASLGEARFQIQADRPLFEGDFQVTLDGLIDPVFGRYNLDHIQGSGLLDLRTLYFSQELTDSIDIKFGRQILTWGTGDLMFINDLFPKDWNSFFIGRDEEYLKAPSDAFKVSYFSDVANLDVVYTPQFDNDRYLDGRRVSYYSGTLGRVVGQDGLSIANTRVDAFDEDELSVRLYKNIKGYETAGYLYSGYWKSPQGQTASGTAYFPEMNVYGASVRGPVAVGIGNIELGYYDSIEDDDGRNANVRNSELRFLVGYEQELLPELTGAFQWYTERMMNYDGYRNNLPAGSVQKDKTRQVFTIRLTKFMMNQNLRLSLFNFYSPTDQDGYARPNIQYKIDDNWRVEGGGNIFYGADSASFFGQFVSNSNLYLSARYSF